MIDTDTLFMELGRLFKCSPDKFFCRVSMAKYIEKKFKNNGLPWNWMCKVGLKDNSFDARLTNVGVKEHADLLDPKFSKRLSKAHHLNDDQIGIELYRLLNSYDEYLNEKMRPKIKEINKEK